MFRLPGLDGEWGQSLMRNLTSERESSALRRTGRTRTDGQCPASLAPVNLSLPRLNVGENHQALLKILTKAHLSLALDENLLRWIHSFLLMSCLDFPIINWALSYQMMIRTYEHVWSARYFLLPPSPYFFLAWMRISYNLRDPRSRPFLGGWIIRNAYNDDDDDGWSMHVTIFQTPLVLRDDT